MDTKTKYGRRGGRAYRSRLEPFVDFIRVQRQQRKTWQEIAESLSTEKGCAITFQGLHQFYRRYVKRQGRPHWEREATAMPPIVKAAADTPARKTMLAETPSARPFRQPNPENINLSDPTKI